MGRGKISTREKSWLVVPRFCTLFFNRQGFSRVVNKKGSQGKIIAMEKQTCWWFFFLSRSTQMKKVMLTVFKHNHGAYQFFREGLQ